MKNQYFGDHRDLVKYDLLLELTTTLPELRRLVFVPMLTPNDASSHGRKILYERDGFRADVFEFLRGRVVAGDRDIRRLRELFRERPFEYLPYREDSHFGADRHEYFANLPSEWLQDALIFFDPDNGFEPKNTTSAHLRFTELADVMRRSGDHSVAAVFQFLPHEQRPAFFSRVEESVRQVLPRFGAIAVEDGSVSFLVLARNQHISRLLTWLPGYLSARSLRPLPRRATSVEPFQLLLPHFAYGSNMCDTWLQRDAPSARAVGSATLDGYSLVFDKESGDGSAKASIERRSGGQVLGVLFAIEPVDMPRLNTKEGGYRPIQITVWDAAGAAREAWTLEPTSRGTSLQPWRWYVDLIVAGARHHGIADDYVRRLDEVPTQSGGAPADVDAALACIERLRRPN